MLHAWRSIGINRFRLVEMVEVCCVLLEKQLGFKALSEIINEPLASIKR